MALGLPTPCPPLQSPGANAPPWVRGSEGKLTKNNRVVEHGVTLTSCSSSVSFFFRPPLLGLDLGLDLILDRTAEVVVDSESTAVTSPSPSPSPP